MDLEQKVQRLEQEILLLKAQIQTTLLDIQEQLLNNAYPELRTESGTSAKATAPTVLQPELPAIVQKVRLDEPGSTPPEYPTLPHALDWASLSEMETWAGEKVARHGRQRTLELIDTYTSKGRFTEEVRDALVHYVMMYDQEPAPRKIVEEPVTQPTKRNGTTPSEKRPTDPKPAAVTAKPVADEQNHQVRKNILKLIAGIQNIGVGGKHG